METIGFENNNEDVEVYLNSYLKEEIENNYAVVLKGKWGVGKTVFIKNWINEINKKFSSDDQSLNKCFNFSKLSRPWYLFFIISAFYFILIYFNFFIQIK